MILRNYLANEVVALENQQLTLKQAREIQDYLASKKPAKMMGSYVEQVFKVNLSQLLRKAGLDVNNYPSGVSSTEKIKLELLAESQVRGFLKKKLNQIMHPVNLGLNEQFKSTRNDSILTEASHSEFSLSNSKVAPNSRSKIQYKDAISPNFREDTWHSYVQNHLVLVLGKDKTVEDAKGLLLEEMSKPIGQQSIPVALAHPQLSSVPGYKKDEVRLERYFSSERINQAEDFLKDAKLFQCGAVTTCLDPGKQIGLDLILPPKLKLSPSMKSTQNPNFNSLVFDYLHKAVQSVFAALKADGGTGDQFVQLNNVIDPKIHKFTQTELAMIQYCHFMNYNCIDKNNKKLGAQILTAYGLEIDKTSKFYEAFERFIFHASAAHLRQLRVDAVNEGLAKEYGALVEEVDEEQKEKVKEKKLEEEIEGAYEELEEWEEEDREHIKLEAELEEEEKQVEEAENSPYTNRPNIGKP